MPGKLCTWNDLRETRAYCEGRAYAAGGGDKGDNPHPGVPTGLNPGVVTGAAADDNAILWRAKADSGFSVALVDPEGNDQALAVSATGSAITVDLATGPAGAITSTATEIIAAVEADSPGAADLVTVADQGDSDGSGVAVAEVQVSRSDSIFADYAPDSAAWDAGHDSWAADPAGVPPRDCCADAYGGGYTPP
jgi:hypothetical protein